MTEVKIPNHIMRFKSAILGCRYSLDGESLYSVKWYKDGHEFYRYVPRNKPPGQAFPLPGVTVDLRNSSDTQVMLRRVTLQSTGVYKCEVSGEAPAFNTVSESETMTVVMTPSRGPRITGGQTRYQIGDTVRVNCTSSASKPVCHLSWLINGEPASRSYLKYYNNRVIGNEYLEQATLGLEFKVRAYHFKNGDMKLKCVAKISSLYFQSREARVISDHPDKAPALESRETVAAKSRAHGASSGGSIHHMKGMPVNYLLTLLCCLSFLTAVTATATTSITTARRTTTTNKTPTRIVERKTTSQRTPSKNTRTPSSPSTELLLPVAVTSRSSSSTTTATTTVKCYCISQQQQQQCYRLDSSTHNFIFPHIVFR
ncbi:beaten path IIIa [Haematobia irritans]|uniref:beaten path IIIa n=1 Tax=Haematobia irritans TaxID=7368 RepID=UPI003F507C79